MRSIVIALFVLIPVQGVAAGAFTGTTTATFNVREILDGAPTTVSKSGPLSVNLTTDYSTLRWSLSWNVNLVMSGGPSQSFETDLIANGSLDSRRCVAGTNCMVTNDPSPLTFPDANGKSGAGQFVLYGNAGWSLTDRIVTTTRTRTKPSNPVLSADYPGTQIQGQVLSPGTQSLTVADYPNSITLTPGFTGVNSYQDAVGQWLRGFGGATLTLGKIVDGANSLEVYISGFPSSIALTESPAGDFTNNNVVDAADYVLWRKSPGPLSPFLTNYDVWRGNFGNSIGSSAAVPEPATLLLVGLLAVFPLRWRNR